MRPQLLLASNVRHTSHIVQAGIEAGFDVEHYGLYRPTPGAIRQLKRLGLPDELTQRVQRRAQHETVPGESHHSIGPAQFVPTLLGAVNVPYKRGFVRAVHAAQRVRVRRGLTRRTRVIHAFEGLLGDSPRNGCALVLERRGLHHKAFEELTPTVADFPWEGPYKDPLGSLLSAEYELADKIVVYSEVARRSFVDRGFDPARIAVVPIPFGAVVSPPATVEESGVGRVVFVGRATVEKGIDVAVRAAGLCDEVREMVVIGSCSKAVRAWLSEQPKTIYMGVQPWSVIERTLRSADLFVMPAVESFGLAVLEAVSCGVPVLVSDTAGVCDAIQQQAPESMVIGRSPEVWAARIGDALAMSRERRADWVRRQGRTVRTFGWDESVARQQAIYLEMQIGVIA